MGVSNEFESLEKQFLELIGEFRSITTSENRLREAVRAEASRAEAGECARAAAERAAAEARSAAAAAAASATQAAAELTAAHEQNTAFKVQLELAERQRSLLEERCIEMSGQISAYEREVQQLRPLQSAQTTLQRQYTDLQESICVATEDARRETSRLESELRRVERCVGGGAEIRERARLAAAAHARERRLAAAELQHTTRELHTASVEVSRLGSIVAELQIHLTQYKDIALKQTKIVDPDAESLAEVRAVLEAGRAGTAKLERALAAALADNASLAARIHSTDNTSNPTQLPSTPSGSTNISPIDSFLAE